MDKEKKKSLILIIFLLLVTATAIILFFWGSLINRGTLEVTADTPFSVEIFKDKEYVCETSPCQIRQTIGMKDFLIKKQGHKTVVKSEKIKLWRTTSVAIDFQINPFLSAAQETPTFDNSQEYRLITESGLQKLIQSDDSSRIAIVNFPNAIRSPQIIGSNKAALVIQTSSPQKAYKVNISGKSRTQIEQDFDFSTIIDGKWSADGQFLVFTTPEGISILNAQNEITTTNILTTLDQVAWTDANNLIFATNQNIRDTGNLGPLNNAYIELQEGTQEENIIFASYNTNENSYTKIYQTDEITQLPTNLIIAAGLAKIYFTTPEGSFQITLKKV